MKVAFISMHPAPYRDALIGALVKGLDGAVDVYNLYDSDAGHKFWELPKPSYTSKCITDGMSVSSRFRLLMRLLKMFVFNARYACVIWPGYVEWPVRIAIITSALLGKKYVLSIDSVEQPPVGKLAFAVKRWMIRRAALVFVPGQASKSFMMGTFAVSESKILCGAYALDGVKLEEKISELRQNGARADVRRRLGIPGDATMFLMVANMIPTRQYPITSAGFVEFARERSDCVFVMVGKGPDHPKMSQYASEHPCLRVIEGCSFGELLKLYAAADVYVHGGKEPASTALMIGAIAHLPLISSDAVGCSFDVLKDDETGFKVADYKSVRGWSEAFALAKSRSSDWQGFGDVARALSEKLDSDNVAEELSRCLSRILA